ncbi:MAG: hypothetical protein RIQ96_504 [Pseudomonadota bacterium]
MRRELHRVAQQVQQHLPQPRRVAHQAQRHVGGQLALQRHALALRGEGQCLQRAVHQLAQLQRRALQLHLPGLDLGEVEDVVDDRQQRLRRLLHHVQIFTRLPGQIGLERQRGHTHDAVHRRADLVAHGGKEHRLGAVGLLRIVARLLQRGLAALALVDVDGAAAVPQKVARLIEYRLAGQAYPFGLALGRHLVVLEVHKGLARVQHGAKVRHLGALELGGGRQHIPRAAPEAVAAYGFRNAAAHPETGHAEFRIGLPEAVGADVGEVHQPRVGGTRLVQRIAQFVLLLLQLGDVHRPTHHAALAVQRPGHQRGAAGAQLAVFAAHPHLMLGHTLAAGQLRAHRIANCNIHIKIGRLVACRVAQQALKRGVGVAHVAARREHHGHRAGVEHRLQRLALPRRVGMQPVAFAVAAPAAPQRPAQRHQHRRGQRPGKVEVCWQGHDLSASNARLSAVAATALRSPRASSRASPAWTGRRPCRRPDRHRGLRQRRWRSSR